MSDPSVVALVPVVERAESRGGGLPAALALVAGVSLLTHAVRRLLRGGVGRVFVVSEGSEVDELPAGADWFRGTLAEAAAVLAPGADVVLVHDPVRAFAPPELVADVVAEVIASGRPVVPVLPCSDTVKQLDDAGLVLATPDRAGLRVAQTPIGYPGGHVLGRTLGMDAPAGARAVAGHPEARRLDSAVDLVTARDGAA